MPTKPLIEQLAERAGVNLEAAPVLWDAGTAAMVLFELCAYLDEREAHVPCNAVPFEGPQIDCCLESGHAGDCQPKPKAPVSTIDWSTAPPNGELCKKCGGPLRGWDYCDNGCHKGCVDDEPPAAPEVAEAGPGFAHCGHGYASGSPNCVQCHPTEENITYLVNQHRHLKEDLAEARAELASRCDHHAAIHELNRELVEAREMLARAGEERREWEAKAREQGDIVVALSDEVGAFQKDSANHAAELAKVTAERDQLLKRAKFVAFSIRSQTCRHDTEQASHEAECFLCGTLDCPTNCELHYHHDGCADCDNPALTAAAAAKPPEETT